MVVKLPLGNGGIKSRDCLAGEDTNRTVLFKENPAQGRLWISTVPEKGSPVGGYKAYLVF